MANLSVFDFNGNQVRIVMRGKHPWFVAKDLCDVLDISNIRQNITKLDPDEKDVCSVDTPGGNQDTTIVSESGMYAIVLTSRKPEAQAFRKWLTSEVLPEIRETGSYTVKPAVKTLPPADVRIDRLYTALTGFGIELDNPRYSQAIKDLVLDKIIGESRALPESTEEWLGVAEKAERMGYAPAMVTKYRSQLGKYVSANSESLECRSERRLCNGTMRPINLYRDCPELEEAITEFMDAKVLAQ
jgi:hypothetical protein